MEEIKNVRIQNLFWRKKFVMEIFDKEKKISYAVKIEPIEYDDNREAVNLQQSQNRNSIEESEESNMKLGDIYKNKENNSIIQIDSFAAPMGKFGEGESIIVFRQIERHNEFEIGSCPSFNGYGTQEEIETEYELLVSQENLSNYSDWDEIFQLIEKSK